MATPDLTGFREAQATLRAKFGEVVPFFKPLDTVWPAGAVLDPEQGRPMDPTVLPLASGWASAGVRASVVARPMGLSRRGVENDIEQTAVGNIETGTIVLIVGYDDWTANELDDATEVEVHQERYEIAQTENDQLGPGSTERVLAYCTQL